MAIRNRQTKLGVNFWLSNEEAETLCLFLVQVDTPNEEAQKKVIHFHALFNSDAPNGEYDVLGKEEDPLRISSDSELPGMWERSDLEGGWADTDSNS